MVTIPPGTIPQSDIDASIAIINDTITSKVLTLINLSRSGNELNSCLKIKEEIDKLDEIKTLLDGIVIG